MILTGENRSTRRETCHSATLCTTNSTFDCPGFNKAVSKNRTALFVFIMIILVWARCWWRSWFRHSATIRKLAGSIPDGVIGMFSLT